MAENIENDCKDVDVRPKTTRSRSADRKDGYVWSGKKLSWSKKNESSSDAETVNVIEKIEVPLRSQERKHSCSSIELDLDHSCGHRFLGRSLKQKLQDAVGQCFPIKNCSSRHSSGLPSKRKIHISELMLDKCPFPPRSDLAFRWHFIKRHTAPINPKSDDWVSTDLSQSELRDIQLKRRNTEEEINCFAHTNVQPCVITTNTVSCGSGPMTGSVMNLVSNNSIEDSDMDSDDEIITLCTSSRKRNKPKWELDEDILQLETPPKYHTQIDYVHYLVPDLLQINNNPCYWGVMDKYAAEALLEGKPEGKCLKSFRWQMHCLTTPLPKPLLRVIQNLANLHKVGLAPILGTTQVLHLLCHLDSHQVQHPPLCLLDPHQPECIHLCLPPDHPQDPQHPFLPLDHLVPLLVVLIQPQLPGHILRQICPFQSSQDHMVPQQIQLQLVL